ncbi:hypothetical protein, partial [Mesorhizobium sp. M2A.F.Ca.ET.015.02.1.1]|uniref:hypothetical protein n=1 Tax=Mesorhizobium sp. M2A.F.Ca.ET.015.02.1.1 TaxID=2496758 RepID=UPI001AEC930A
RQFEASSSAEPASRPRREIVNSDIVQTPLFAPWQARQSRDYGPWQRFRQRRFWRSMAWL